MPYLFILIGGAIFGGPFGFVIGLVICGYIMYQKEVTQSDLEEKYSSNKRTSSRNSTSSNSYKPQIEVLAPCINILSNFALRYESKWTTEKVKHIKKIFSDICTTESDHLYLREQLKGGNHIFLKQNINSWLSLDPSIDDRKVIFQSVVSLLLITCNNSDKVRADSLSLGEDIGLSWGYCNNFLDEIFYDGSDNHSTNSSNDSVIEQAAKTLGVSVNASVDEIQKAFRKKIRDFHPDRNVNVTDSVREMLNEQTRLLNDAREIMLQQEPVNKTV